MELRSELGVLKSPRSGGRGLWSAYAEGGGDRLFERQRERMDDLRIAEGGGDRTFQRLMQRLKNLRIAEGGSDRLIERQANRG